MNKHTTEFCFALLLDEFGHMTTVLGRELGRVSSHGHLVHGCLWANFGDSLKQEPEKSKFIFGSKK